MYSLAQHIIFLSAVRMLFQKCKKELFSHLKPSEGLPLCLEERQVPHSGF